MKAVLMAGGFGTRIQPLTHAVPKPMIPLINRPMMEHIVARLRDAGIIEIVVLLYHMPDTIKEYFGDGSRFGVKLHYVLPDGDFGTAGAVKCAEFLLDETFIVISGDLVTDFDIAPMIEFHRSKKTPATITLTSVPNPLQFGVVITDSDSRIVRFLEKPGWGEVFSDTVNTGIYILEPKIFSFIPAEEPFDFSKDLFPIFMRENRAIYGYDAAGYWRDVGNPDSYREAVGEILAGEVSINCGGTPVEFDEGIVYAAEGFIPPTGMRVRGRVCLGRGVVIGEGAAIGDSVIGDDCVIGPRTVIFSSTLWKGVKVGAGCEFADVVLCDGVTAGDEVRMCAGAIVAGSTEIGDRTTFERDIMVWPDKKIESDSVVSANLVWGDKWKKSVFESGIVKGNTNVELSPEFAAKLGAALGSVLPGDGHILVGRDYLRASRMLKRAFLGGMLSTGVNVNDVKMLPLPLVRYKLAGFGEVGGVYFRQSDSSSRATEIVFFDEAGNLIDANGEKSVERLFFKEDFRRAEHSGVGEIKELLAINEFYKEGFLRELDVDAVRNRRFKIVLDLGFGTTGDHLPPLLTSLGCQPVVLNAYPDERRLMRHAQNRNEALRQVGEIVRTLNADAGFCLSPDGEQIYMVDDMGRVVKPHKTLMLILMLLAKTRKGSAKIFLPVTAPRILDVYPGLATTRGKTVGIRSSDMHEYDLIAPDKARYGFPSFLHAPDGMFTVAKLLEMLALCDASFSSVLGEVPPYCYEHRKISCPVDKKGLAMRRMSEDSLDKEASFVDGIQVFTDIGSVLLLPDPHAPELLLLAEGDDDHETFKLADEYAEKVREWIGGQ